MHYRKYIGIFVLLIIFAILPLFVHSPYHINLLVLVGIYSVIAMTFVLILKTGLITLAIAAFWGIGAYSSATLVMKLNLSFWISLPTSALITGLIALVLGIILVRASGFTFVIMTMLVGMIFPLLIGNTPFFGGYEGIRGIPPPNSINIPLITTINFESNVSYYYLMLLLFVVVVAFFYVFYRTWTGRSWTSIGLNSQLAQSLGINIFRYKLLAFVLANTAAGLMGSFYAHYIGSLLPDTFGLFKTIYFHIYAILGGIGFPFLGPLVGSFVMVLFPEFMRITRLIEPLITGTLLILLVVFLPSGILSLPGLRYLTGDSNKRVIHIHNAIKSLLPPGRYWKQ